MNMEIVQICDITLAVKFALKTKTNIEYFPFEYERNIEFLFSKNKIDFLEKNYKVGNIEEWFDYCLNLGLEDIKILLPISSKNLNIPNDLNTNKIKFICYFKNNLILYFTPKWEKTRLRKDLLLQNEVGKLFRSREQNGIKDIIMQKAFLNMQ